jgi:hypothetical protein
MPRFTDSWDVRGGAVCVFGGGGFCSVPPRDVRLMCRARARVQVLMLAAAFMCVIYLVSFAGVPLVSGHVSRSREDLKAGGAGVEGEEEEGEEAPAVARRPAAVDA